MLNSQLRLARSNFIFKRKTTSAPRSALPADPPFDAARQTPPPPAAAWTYRRLLISMHPKDRRNCPHSGIEDNPPPRFVRRRGHVAPTYGRPRFPWNTGRHNSPDTDDRTSPM